MCVVHQKEVDADADYAPTVCERGISKHEYTGIHYMIVFIYLCITMSEPHHVATNYKHDLASADDY